MYDIAMSGGG